MLAVRWRVLGRLPSPCPVPALPQELLLPPGANKESDGFQAAPQLPQLGRMTPGPPSTAPQPPHQAVSPGCLFSGHLLPQSTAGLCPVLYSQEHLLSEAPQCPLGPSPLAAQLASLTREVGSMRQLPLASPGPKSRSWDSKR